MKMQIEIFVLALTHSLWLGIVVALIVAIFLKMLPDKASALRSFVCLSAIYALFALFLLAFVAIASQRSDIFPIASLRSRGEFANTIFALWVIGMLNMLSRTGRDWLAGEKAIRQSQSHSDPHFLQMAVRLAAALGVKRPILLRQTRNGASPYSFGLWRPVILTPAACLAQLSVDELEAVLAHEIAHIARFDFLHACLTSVVRAFLFFNPAVHWLYDHYRLEAEKACDDLAVGVIATPTPLASGLLRLGLATTGQLAISASGPEREGGTALRIRAERLLEKRPSNITCKSRMTFNSLNIGIAAAILSTVFITASIAKPDLMSEEKLVSLKRALCDVLEEDNIFGNSYYDPGGPATLIAMRNRDEVIMNGKVLPVATAHSVKALFDAYHVDYGDVTHMRYLARDIKLTVKTRLNNGGQRATIYQTYVDKPGLKFSKRRLDPPA